jgi:hypothetical protein
MKVRKSPFLTLSAMALFALSVHTSGAAGQAGVSIAGDVATVSISTSNGQDYTLEQSQDLARWSALKTFSGSGSVVEVSVDPAPSPVFFRVRESDGPETTLALEGRTAAPGSLTWAGDGTILAAWTTGSDGCNAVYDATSTSAVTLRDSFGDSALTPLSIEGGFEDGTVFVTQKDGPMLAYTPSNGQYAVSASYTTGSSTYYAQARKVPGAQILICAVSDGSLHLFKRVDGAWTDNKLYYNTAISIEDIAVSHDGKTLAICGYASYATTTLRLYLYDVAQLDKLTGGTIPDFGPRIGTWTTTLMRAQHIAYSLDDKRVFVDAVKTNGTSNSIYITDVSTPADAAQAGEWTGVAADKLAATSGNGLAFIESGTLHLASGTSTSLLVDKGTLAVSSDAVFAVSPDGAHIAIVDKNEAGEWFLKVIATADIAP